MSVKIDTIRHSVAHIMAVAVQELHPGVRFGMGPAIENGFYYDFDNLKISEIDLPKIEKKMRKIIKEDIKFKKKEKTKTEAKKLFKAQPYKLELINELTETRSRAVARDRVSIISIYETGDFIDLCAGPHIKSTKEIPLDGFKLIKTAGAYWKGDEKNPMLTRIYGVAFESKKELQEYLKTQIEAEKRDHRKLGEKLKIFMFSELVGPGLPLWLPNGAVLIEELETLAKNMERKAGYLRVKTPHIAKEIMYKTSGHLPYYADSMFPPMILEEDGQKTKYYLKAMNCPHHHQIYASEIRSYRDLPLRLAEYGEVYRYEKSGELFGIMRTRSMQMNDAHIYCTEDQFSEEFMAVIKMYLEYFKIFGIKKYVMRFSTHSKKGLGKKYIDNEKLWEKTETMVRDVMTKKKIPFIEVPDEAAFYGPKIDVEIWSVIGREFTLATNQVDFAVPERFGLKYIDKNGKEKTPICIHRAPLSTHERLIGFLIEHYAGAFPVWLSPVQVWVIPVGSDHKKYAQEVYDALFNNGIRIEIKNENETVSKKIREGELQKIPYILVVGDKEIAKKSVRIRERGKGDIGMMNLDKFIIWLNSLKLPKN